MVRKRNKQCADCKQPTSKLRCRSCSQKHNSRAKHEAYITRWLNGEEHGMKGKTSISKHIRKYLFEKHDNKCQQCGWSKTNPQTNTIPLEVHHIDGDWTNNTEDNLELLCPNCHSLTKTFRFAGGRKSSRTNRPK